MRFPAVYISELPALQRACRALDNSIYYTIQIIIKMQDRHKQTYREEKV